ncbi:MAG: N-6 DNA methylase [Saprospiraceae bacterium]|nr:N-6 DNA methylase [Saprospiraceae bacterium]
MTQKEIAYGEITELVERFGEQYDSYKKADYNETLTRRDFIDPFFKALGWDIDNKNGYAEAYREVIHEDKVKVGKTTKAPDYSFRLVGGKRLFFVEAKKPSVVVKDEVPPAYQIRRYGWSAKLPISIITDFEEFSIYDCTKKPNPTDKASVARIKYLTFKDYLKEFEFLWDTFSKERVLKGSFDKFVQSNASKKGTATVDKEFLESLDNWRTYLATSISWNNKNLDEDEINFVVQQTIDRIIFLRIAEDRSVEHYGNLLTAIKQGDYYQNLFSIFKEADEKYNSGIFDFKKDQISKDLKIENKIIKTILTELYYPESPFEFSVLPIEILGSAYEQFLGKVIRITPSHHAKIEEKPEVRKAGGVYYTPQYIVDYIVKNTVGKLVEGKAPKQVSEIKIVDPACGSGSFLIGAYQFLLDWHRQYYTSNSKPSKGTKNNPLTPEGNLTTSEKKRILLNNIYGVDIDVNAVEVTKLSLLLKCMEGETNASISNQLRMFNERVLPTLDDNIKDGNSLIDTDFYASQLDFGDEKKIKPFNWQKSFLEVFKMGGFDVVIGNPPYVRQELIGVFKNYFESHYKVYHGMADLYSYFIERGIGLLNDDGIFGIIVANKWMRSNYGEPLRKWLKQQNIYEIIDFGDLRVFESATTYPCILIASKSDKNINNINITNVKSLLFDSLQSYIQENRRIILKDKLDDAGWNLGSETESNLLIKLKQNSVPLGDYVKGKIYRGVLTGLNEAFVIDEATKEQLVKEDKRSDEIIKPFLAGRDVKRYQQPQSKKYLIFAKRGINIDQYPAIKNYLQQFKKQLTPKPKDYKGEDWPGRKSGSYKWYEIQDAVDYYKEFEVSKIIVPAIVKSASYTFDSAGFYSNDKTSIIPIDDKFLLGVISSKCLDYFLKSIAATRQGGYFEYKPMYVLKLPIRIIDFKNKSEVQQHDEITSIVEQVLMLNNEIQSINLESKRKHIQNKIEYCENRINEIVYQLYRLNEDEIKVIENS